MPESGKAVILQDCLYVPSLEKLSLLSVRKCQSSGLHVIGHDDIPEVRQAGGTVICFGREVGNGLFELQLRNGLSQIHPQHMEFAMTTYRQWHDALRHPAFIAPTLYADGILFHPNPPISTAKSVLACEEYTPQTCKAEAQVHSTVRTRTYAPFRQFQHSIHSERASITSLVCH